MDDVRQIHSHLFNTSSQILNKQFPEVVQSLQLLGLKLVKKQQYLKCTHYMM